MDWDTFFLRALGGTLLLMLLAVAVLVGVGIYQNISTTRASIELKNKQVDYMEKTIEKYNDHTYTIRL